MNTKLEFCKALLRTGDSTKPRRNCSISSSCVEGSSCGDQNPPIRAYWLDFCSVPVVTWSRASSKLVPITIPEPRSHRRTQRRDRFCQLTACCPSSKVIPQNPGIGQVGKIC